MQRTQWMVGEHVVWCIMPDERPTISRTWLYLAGTYTLPDEQPALLAAANELTRGGIEPRLVAANKLGNLIDLYRPTPPPLPVKP